jgi:hypothetical protein
MHPVNTIRLVIFPILQTHGTLWTVYIVWGRPAQPVVRGQYFVRDIVQSNMAITSSIGAIELWRKQCRY